MRRHYGFDSKYYKCMGFMTVCFMVVGLVFYTIFMIRTFVNGTDWLVGILLVFGELAMLTLLPALANSFMALGCTIERDHINDLDD
ncbi:MAG: hypothetical protein KBS97_01435 [Firmicutes bacterium]|nr:hypothetical protein [Candidatus Fiminaster equi]